MSNAFFQRGRKNYRNGFAHPPRSPWLRSWAVFFKVVYGCQNDTLKFCNDTLNSEGLDIVCLVVKQNDLRKACFPARGYCSKRLQCSRPTQCSGAEVGSENCNFVSVHCHTKHTASPSLRPLTILPQICTVWCTKLRKHFNAIMDVFYFFTDTIGLPGDASDYTEDKKSAVAARIQKGGCRVRQQWELGVRFWPFGPHCSSCQKIKMMRCALFHCDW